MDEYGLKQLKAFEDLLAEFEGVWNAVDLRVGWARVHKMDVCLFAHILLDTRKPNEITDVLADPSVPPFHAKRFIKPISALPTILDGIRKDKVEVDGLEVAIGKCDQKGDFSAASGGNFHLSSQHVQRSTQHTEIAIASFDESKQSVSETTGYALSDSELSESLRALPAPYANLDDVLNEFFGKQVSSYSDSHAFVSVAAPIPISIAASSGYKLERGRLCVTASKGLDLEEIRVGRIINSRSGEKKRDTVDWKREEWRESNGTLLALKTWPADDEVGMRFFLRYKKIILGSFERVNSGTASGNARTAAHQYFDPEYELLLDWLTGVSKNPSSDFELAVSWLFHLSGLTPVFYGVGKNIQDEIDLVHIHEPSQLALGIECTTKTRDLSKKLGTLYSRCEAIKKKLGGMAVLPVLATSQPTDEIADSEKEYAGREGITILTQTELAELFQMALRNQPAKEVIQYLREGGAAIRDAGNSIIPLIRGF